jgi:hypothetical protein
MKKEREKEDGEPEFKFNGKRILLNVKIIVVAMWTSETNLFLFTVRNVS